MGRERILYEGMLVGLAGAIAVAVWFFVYDVAEGTPFRTPALLGAALLLFCCFEVAALAAMAVLASWLLDTLRPWAIIGANFLAALIMLGLLFRDHHVSFRELLTSGE